MTCRFQGHWPDMSVNGQYGALDTYLLTVPWLTQPLYIRMLHDWGGGRRYAKNFCTAGVPYTCVDGTPPADEIDDLATRRVPCDSLLLRHILENNPEDWREILLHALAAFQRRMAIVNFRAFADRTQVEYEDSATGIPYMRFAKADIDEVVGPYLVGQCSIQTTHPEHVWYLEKQ